MRQGGYNIRNKAANHFLTLTVVEWIDVFTRKEYRDILLDSIRFCQQNKGLILNAWCLMSNHMHLVARATNLDLSDILCDLKKFTSKQIVQAIINNKHESRRDWMLLAFKAPGANNSRNKEFQFWRQENRPMELCSSAFTFQKIN